MLCTQVLNGLDRSMENIPLNIGKDFNVVTVSIDPDREARASPKPSRRFTRACMAGPAQPRAGIF